MEISGLYDCDDAKYDRLSDAAFKAEQRKSNPKELLADAVEQGDLTKVIQLIQQGADPNTGPLPCLHRAAFHGRLEVCRYLITIAKSYPDSLDTNGMTPLHRAALKGQLVVCRYLVEEAKADVWIADKTNFTALQLAMKHGHDTVGQYLITQALLQPPVGGFVPVSEQHIIAMTSPHELIGCRVIVNLKGGLFSKKQEKAGTIVKYDEYKVKHQVRFDDGEAGWYSLDFKRSDKKYRLLKALPRAPITSQATFDSPTQQKASHQNMEQGDAGSQTTGKQNAPLDKTIEIEKSGNGGTSL